MKKIKGLFKKIINKIKSIVTEFCVDCDAEMVLTNSEYREAGWFMICKTTYTCPICGKQKTYENMTDVFNDNLPD